VRRAACAIALATLLAGGCGGGAGAAGSAGSTSPLPVATSAAIDPNFDTGQTVLLTSRGVRPLWLVSQVGKPVEFRNVSGSSKTVRFDHAAVDSGPIAPGAVFRYTPRLPLSLTYHVGTVEGKLQVSPLEGSAP
jgi:hypothetical protein